MKRAHEYRGRQVVLGLAFVAGPVLLTACVGVVPLPASNHVERGCQITPSQAAFIKRGHTTREEVIAQLGTNYVILPGVIAYSWELKGGGGVWWVYVPFFDPNNDIAESGRWTGGWRGFFVAFNEDGIVRARAFKSLCTSKPLQHHMEKWVNGLPPEHSSSARR